MGSESKTKLNPNETQDESALHVSHVKNASHVYEITRPSVSVPVEKIREIKKLCCASEQQRAFSTSEVFLALFSAFLGSLLSKLAWSDLLTSLESNAILIFLCILFLLCYISHKRNERKSNVDLAKTIQNLLSDYPEDSLGIIENKFEEEIKIYNENLLSGPLTNPERIEK